MRYYIIAGEASGDLHASNLVDAIKKIEPNAEFRGLGGDKMKDAGVQLVLHYKQTAYMGYVAVLMNLRKILGFMKLCKKDIQQYNPDAVILVDYPGFNLKIAEFAHQLNYRVLYYISPKIWAWKTYRVKQIKKYVDLMLSILPFEVDFYKKHNYNVEYTGNPVLDNIVKTLDRNQKRDSFISKYSLSGKPIIALLPGSRKQEIKSLLPTMIKLANSFPDYETVVSAAPGIEESFYEKFLKSTDIKIIFNDTYQLLLHSEAAAVSSGTATLETALIGTPQVVCYKVEGGFFTFLLSKIVIKSKYISLVNLILNKLCVTEMIQQQFNLKSLTSEIQQLLYNPDKRTAMLNDYSKLMEIMGKPGALENAAIKIVGYMKNINQTFSLSQNNN